MTLQQYKNKADAKLATFWSALVTKQEAYYNKHGKYFQLLVTPTAPVVDGVDSDFITTIPGDEQHILDVDFQFSTKIPFNIRVDEWVGPNGKGFKATARVELPDGRKFQRSRSHADTGAEVDSGWSEVIKRTI